MVYGMYVVYVLCTAAATAVVVVHIQWVTLSFVETSLKPWFETRP